MLIDEMLDKMMELKASDLFIIVGKPPCLKVNGVFTNLSSEALTAEEVRKIILGLMDEKQREKFSEHREFNFAIKSKNNRFRVSAFYERFNVGAVIRAILTEIPTLELMGLPPILKDLAMVKHGLVLVVGATGVGKSTTMAAMLNHRNQSASGHIVTIEDPIEYIHKHEKCIITQREVGVDTESYGMALKNTLRQAPDVILIGEIRTSEVMEYAMQFSETGHLCLATMHANNANQALDRIISFFPAVKKHQVLLELSLNLKAIIAQQLLPRIDMEGRIAAMEILLTTPIIQECIRNGEIEKVKEYMNKGQNSGMKTFDVALFELYKRGKISYEDAVHYADSENELRLMIKLDKGSPDDIGSLSGVGLKE